MIRFETRKDAYVNALSYFRIVRHKVKQLDGQHKVHTVEELEEKMTLLELTASSQVREALLGLVGALGAVSAHDDAAREHDDESIRRFQPVYDAEAALIRAMRRDLGFESSHSLDRLAST